VTTLVPSRDYSIYDRLCRFGVVHVMFAVLSALSVMFSLFLGVHVSENLG